MVLCAPNYNDLLPLLLLIIHMLCFSFRSTNSFIDNSFASFWRWNKAKSQQIQCKQDAYISHVWRKRCIPIQNELQKMDRILSFEPSDEIDSIQPAIRLSNAYGYKVEKSQSWKNCPMRYQRWYALHRNFLSIVLSTIIIWWFIISLKLTKQTFQNCNLAEKKTTNSGKQSLISSIIISCELRIHRHQLFSGKLYSSRQNSLGAHTHRHKCRAKSKKNKRMLIYCCWFFSRREKHTRPSRLLSQFKLI